MCVHFCSCSILYHCTRCPVLRYMYLSRQVLRGSIWLFMNTYVKYHLEYGSTSIYMCTTSYKGIPVCWHRLHLEVRPVHDRCQHFRSTLLNVEADNLDCPTCSLERHYSPDIALRVCKDIEIVNNFVWSKKQKFYYWTYILALKDVLRTCWYYQLPKLAVSQRMTIYQIPNHKPKEAEHAWEWGCLEIFTPFLIV